MCFFLTSSKCHNVKYVSRHLLSSAKVDYDDVNKYIDYLLVTVRL